jgi:hypothetical protein
MKMKFWTFTKFCLKKQTWWSSKESVLVAQTNASVESLSISFSRDISLNLKDPNSLRFIEKNSTLKTLNFSSLTFKINEMSILNDVLKNNTINSLVLSQSNFCGPFEFLKNGILEKLDFSSIWSIYPLIKESEFLVKFEIKQFTDTFRFILKTI